MDDTKNILSIRLKQLRTELGLTQEELALKLGLKGKSSIANYESGNTTPSDDIKLKMCEMFDCTMDYLMGKSETKLQTNEISLKRIDKYYEDKVNILLKNKYINEFLKLNLKVFEIDNLIQIINSEDKEVTKNYISLLDNLFSILSLNYGNETLIKIKDLVLSYNKEKINILSEEQYMYQKKQQRLEQKLIDEHIDELHPSILGKASASLNQKIEALLNYLNKNDINNFYMCPVYGRISAGQPNWAEELIEGRIPIDPIVMNISEPEQCFFLKINGESMNKLVRNGSYALIKKQDYADDGDVVVAIVNGDNEATIKKFKRVNDQFVIFEPLSTDESIQSIPIDLKTTSIIILGKYIGKFEMQ